MFASRSDHTRRLTHCPSSVIDKQDQHIIAEATKSLNLANPSESAGQEHGLWMGIRSFDKSSGLCGYTLNANLEQGPFPMVTITDLTEDPRSSDLPFVTGAPYFKYYAATPLISSGGVNIGSLCILDDVVRPHLTRDQVQFIGTLAQTIMSHLAVATQAKEKKKVQRLALGINAFVEGRNDLVMEHMHDDAGQRWATSEGTSKQARRKAAKKTASYKGTQSALPRPQGLSAVRATMTCRS